MPIPESSLGTLDKLPPEVCDLIADHLDLQSLARLGQTSRAGLFLLHHLPAYKDMVTHAPAVLAAFAKSRMIKYHASSVVRQALRGEKLCCSCERAFGGYIFFPTFERVCLTCLNSNLSYWMLPYHVVGLFQFLPRELRVKLPVMTADPRFYNVRCTTLRRHRQIEYIVSAKHVMAFKSLARSEDGVCQRRPSMGPQPPRTALDILNDAETFISIAWYLNGDWAPVKPNFEAEPDLINRNEDYYPGAAYMRFPHVSWDRDGDVKVEHGLSCLGCWYMYELASDVMDPRRRMEHPPRFVLIQDETLLRRDRLHTREEFVEHALVCPGIKLLEIQGGQQ